MLGGDALVDLEGNCEHSRSGVVAWHSRTGVQRIRGEMVQAVWVIRPLSQLSDSATDDL